MVHRTLAAALGKFCRTDVMVHRALATALGKLCRTDVMVHRTSPKSNRNLVVLFYQTFLS